MHAEHVHVTSCKAVTAARTPQQAHATSCAILRGRAASTSQQPIHHGGVLALTWPLMMVGPAVPTLPLPFWPSTGFGPRRLCHQGLRTPPAVVVCMAGAVLLC